MITPPKRRWHKVQSLDDQGPIPLTPAAHARMKARLARVRASLPALIEDTAQASAQGDRSDNAGYKEAKALLRRAQRQILTLEDQLKRVEEIGDGPGASGTVRLGATVVLAMRSPGGTTQEKIFHIVGPFETDPGAGRISHRSPLGAALIGHVKGDVVRVETAQGTREYTIRGVR